MGRPFTAEKDSPSQRDLLIDELRSTIEFERKKNKELLSLLLGKEGLDIKEQKEPSGPFSIGGAAPPPSIRGRIMEIKDRKISREKKSNEA
jgi:hypothetical protein